MTFLHRLDRTIGAVIAGAQWLALPLILLLFLQWPLRDLVRGYDLVINPTRMESFGMAAIEVLAAGVPLLSSRTGVIEQVQKREEMLFPPSRPVALAAALQHLLTNWNTVDFGVARAQENIRSRFLIDHTVARIAAAYERLLA